MELAEFLRELQADVKSQMEDSQPIAELAFADTVMQHMSDIGMTFEPILVPVNARFGSAILRLSGYAMTDDADQLDLFVTLYEGAEEVQNIPDADTKAAASHCVRFLQLCAEGKLASKLDPSWDVRSFAETLQQVYDGLEQIRVFVLTDRVAKSKQFKTLDVAGKAVRLEVMDIERLFRHMSEGKPRDELEVNFNEVSGGPLPCVFVPGSDGEYDYALTAMPGEALRVLYEKFGARLLEANVRSFLSVKAKGVNAGIQTTLRQSPERFMAYNNGIVVVADEMLLAPPSEGGGIVYLKGMQIVNGGQTTASVYFAKRKYPETDLGRVRVPAKIIVMREQDPAREEALVSDISRFANSQNAVKQSDLSANKPFHVEMEKLSNNVYCPDGQTRWFYERAAGSYNTMLSRGGTTAAKLRALKESVPAARRITKTELAKYLTAWDRRPDIVSLGSQKNFDKFMATLTPSDGSEPPLPSVADYKAMVAKAKLYREAQKMIRPMFQAFQANVAAYTVALLSQKIGPRFDLERIWDRQAPSPELMAQLAIWAKEVNEQLQASAGGKMISEWAKRPECREAVLGATYSEPPLGIPEVKPA
jgi:hypothetical protein